MTDSPTPGRHRSRRARRRSRSRGLIGPIVSALSVLLAIGPVVWLMTARDGSAIAKDRPAEVLNISEDNAGPAAIDGTDGPATVRTPLVTVTKTLPGGITTTLTTPGTPILGPAESTESTGSSDSTGPTGSSDSTPAAGDATTTVTVSPDGTRTTVTVTPGGRPTKAGTTKPRPDRPTPKPSPEPTTTEPTATEPTGEPTPDDPPPPSGGGTSDIERQVLDLTNRARREYGCRPLQLDDSLVEAAGRHASDMVRRHYLSHENPDGQGPGERMAAAGFRGSGWGENIAAGYESAQRVFRAWMESEGHRKNILNCRFNRIGIGYDPGRVKPDWGPGSWVQDFGRVDT